MAHIDTFMLNVLAGHLSPQVLPLTTNDSGNKNGDLRSDLDLRVILAVPGALTLLALVSFIVLFFPPFLRGVLRVLKTRRKGKIALSVSDDEGLIPSRSQANGNGILNRKGTKPSQDPFDKIDEWEREDVFDDGCPVNAERFWHKTRIHLSFVFGTSLVLPLLEVALLLLSISANPSAPPSYFRLHLILPSLLFIIPLSYFSFLCLLNLLSSLPSYTGPVVSVYVPTFQQPHPYDISSGRNKEVEEKEKSRELSHWRLTVHSGWVIASSLIAVALGMLLLTTDTERVQTESSPPAYISPQNSNKAIECLRYVRLVVVILEFALVCTIPKWPHRYVPKEKLFKLTRPVEVKEKGEDAVRSSRGEGLLVEVATSQNLRDSGHLVEPPRKIAKADGTFLHSATPSSTSTLVEVDQGGSAEKNVDPRHNITTLFSSSVFSFFAFTCMYPLLSLRRSQGHIGPADIPIIGSFLSARHLFGEVWRFIPDGETLETIASSWFVIKLVVKLNIIPWILLCLSAIILPALTYLSPFLIQRLLIYVDADPTRTLSPKTGWLLALALLLVNFSTRIGFNFLLYIAHITLFSHMRNQLGTILYVKTLKKKETTSNSGDAQKEDAAGKARGKEKEKRGAEELETKAQVMMLMTADLNRVKLLPMYFQMALNSPCEIFFGTFLIYKLMGDSALWGILVTLIFMPITHFAGKMEWKIQMNLMKTRDSRTSIMNEMLEAIRMVKFMGWERRIQKRVEDKREEELTWEKRNYAVQVVMQMIYALVPVIVILVSFLHYIWWRGLSLTPSIAFTAVSIFFELRFALNGLPEVFLGALEAVASLNRIGKYLSLPEIEEMPNQYSSEIACRSASITWPGTNLNAAKELHQDAFMLTLPNVEFPKNQLSLVCGRFGSGKSLLLLSLLGETNVVSGEVVCPKSTHSTLWTFDGDVPNEEWIVHDSVAYLPQTAWLQNSSIKNNILFGLPYNDQRYRDTLQATSLLPDLEIIEGGDEAEIGEKGISLSGGQKARVQLARAVYSRASILLLDDCLSAVDSSTADHIFDQCLQGPLVKGRTVILVSHHVQLVAPAAAYILVLDAGKVKYSGDPDKFLDTDLVADLVAEAIDTKGEVTEGTDPPKSEELAPDDGDTKGKDSELSSSETTPDPTPTGVATPSTPSTKTDEKKQEKRKLVGEEKSAKGMVAFRVWKYYLKSQGGFIFWAIQLSLYIIVALVPVAENSWLRKWSGLNSNPPHDALWYFYRYSAISITGVVFILLRTSVTYIGAIRASRKIHHNMLLNVLFSTMRFQDTTSRGAILNRFAADMQTLDGISNQVSGLFSGLLSLLVIFANLTVVGGPVLSVTMIIVALCYLWNTRYYVPLSRDLRRVISASTSPLFALYSETISGVVVIRAFAGSVNAFNKMSELLDTNLAATWFVSLLQRWFDTRFAILSAFVTFATAAVVVASPSFNGASAGFLLAFATSAPRTIFTTMNRFMFLEQSLVAVERIEDYSEGPTVQKEAPDIVEPRPPAVWPQEGRIEVKDLSVRYAPELPDVLHEVGFVVKPASKVGIVGSTGCGKSTLALTFFRFLEAQKGSIVIDGIDIAKIGLADLRPRLTIIPQNPSILSGTLRSTLDVFSEYDDAQLYEALRRVHLTPSPSEAPDELSSGEQPEDSERKNANIFKNLDSKVSENGDNFSQGERQLICMARAILRRNKIVLMDEATASVDYRTDALITKTVREEFNDSTILTIAHRLRTIIDYDKVMVMDAGRIIEYDSPHILLVNPKSRFYKLCKATGKKEFAVLLKLAAEGAQRRNE